MKDHVSFKKCTYFSNLYDIHILVHRKEKVFLCSLYQYCGPYLNRVSLILSSRSLERCFLEMGRLIPNFLFQAGRLFEIGRF